MVADDKSLAVMLLSGTVIVQPCTIVTNTDRYNLYIVSSRRSTSVVDGPSGHGMTALGNCLALPSRRAQSRRP